MYILYYTRYLAHRKPTLPNTHRSGNVPTLGEESSDCSGPSLGVLGPSIPTSILHADPITEACRWEGSQEAVSHLIPMAPNPGPRGNSYPTCSAATLSRSRKKSTLSPLLMPTPAFTFSKSSEIPGCKLAVFFRFLPKSTSSYITTVQRLVIYKMYFVQCLRSHVILTTT